MATLRANDPRWTDALFWEARGAIAGAPGGVIDLSKVIALYGEGRAAFPKSLALTMAWANANLSAEEFAQSQIGFDDVLSAFAEHRDALMRPHAGAQLPDAASRRGRDGDAASSISAPGTSATPTTGARGIATT